MNALTTEQLNRLFNKYYDFNYGYVDAHGVISEIQTWGNIEVAKSFIKYCLQKEKYCYAAYQGLMVLAQREKLATEEVITLIEIAKQFWKMDMDNFFRDRSVFMNSKYVANLLDVVEFILAQTHEIWPPQDIYWNAYTTLGDAICSWHVQSGRIKLNKALVKRLYDSIQTRKPSENENFIRLSNLRDWLKTLQEKLEALPE